MAWFSPIENDGLTASARTSAERFGKVLRSLRASARFDNLDRNDESTIDKPTAATRLWQQRAWQFYDEIGELHYGGIFVGACLSRCRLTLGYRDSDGNIAAVFDENGEVVTDDQGNRLPGLEQAEEALGYLQALRGAVGGIAQLMASMGVNLHIAGEFHLVGSVKALPTGDSGEEVQKASIDNIKDWQVYSTEEFRAVDNKTYERRSSPGATPQKIIADTVHVIRIWRSHPRFSELPDSSVRAVLDILEELQLLTREVRGEAISRLTNAKVLVIPREIQAEDDESDDGQGEAGDALTRDIIETMMLPITDKASAAQGVPYVLRPPAEYVDKITTLDLSPNNSSDSAEKRAEAVRRLAQGIDLPVEITTGHAGTTFSNAIQIDDSTFKAHVEPVLEIISDGLTMGYLHPALDNPDSILVVHYDSTELVARPNRAQDAKDVHAAFALSDDALRTATGFSDGDAPDDDEIERRVLIQQRIHSRQDIVGGDQAGANNGAPIRQGQLEDGNNLDGQLNAAGVAWVAEYAIERAVRRAGARLRTKAAKNTSIRDLISQVPDADVALTIGADQVSLLARGDDLFHGEFEVLLSNLTRKIGRQPATAIVDFCAQEARNRLFDPRRELRFDQIPILANA